MNKRLGDRFSEEQLKAVIARAIDLDVRGRTTSADELRSIASEMGISPEAVDAALQEHERSLRPRVSRVTGRASSAVVVAGIPLGIAAGTLLGGASPFTTLGSLGVVAVGLVASGALVVIQGKNATIRSFQLCNLLLWGGLTAGGAVTVALIGAGPFALPGIIVGWGLRSWVASSILGSAAVIAVRRAATPIETGGSSATPGEAGSLRSRLLYGTKRIADWLARMLRREMTRTSILRGAAKVASICRSRFDVTRCWAMK